MNNWEKFAEMLGLELGHEFLLTDVYGEIQDWYTYKITENGIFYKSKISDDWFGDKSKLVEELLTGNIKAVPKTMKPTKGEKYWYYSDTCKLAICVYWEDTARDLSFWKVGNCFKTREEAEAKGKEIIEQIRKEYEEA